MCRFVAPSVLGDQWYERPYYLGPDDDDDDYFALAEALQRKNVIGIARWVMRKKRYVGALSVVQRLSDDDDAASRGPGAELLRRRAGEGDYAGDANELKLLNNWSPRSKPTSIPQQWQNEYRQRLCKLIEAKARGEKIEPVRRKKQRRNASLADSLKASIAAVQGEESCLSASKARAAARGREQAPGASVRSLWSGTITFGLVSIPVDLLSAVRPRQTAMKLVDKSGTRWVGNITARRKARSSTTTTWSAATKPTTARWS